MFEFTIDTEKYRIEHSDIDDLIVFSQFSPSELKWKWRQVLDSSDIDLTHLYEGVKDFMEKFLVMVNKTLKENHGEVSQEGGFKNSLEELKYRIANNLKLSGNSLILVDWD